MRVHRFVPALTYLVLAWPASATFDCTFSIHTHKFDLSPLSGLHTISRTESTPPSIENTTFFVDLCQDLRWDDKVYPVEDRCKDGTQGTWTLSFDLFSLAAFLVLFPVLSLLHLYYLDMSISLSLMHSICPVLSPSRCLPGVSQ
jgi:hypothetical protein